MNDKEIKQYIDVTGTATKDLWLNDPIGLPDEEDFEMLKRVIRSFDRKNPGVIEGYVQHAKEQREAAFNDFNASSDKNFSFRHTMTLPADLLRMIEKSYPIMFVNRAHMRWFQKHFPMFVTAKRI